MLRVSDARAMFAASGPDHGKPTHGSTSLTDDAGPVLGRQWARIRPMFCQCYVYRPILGTHGASTRRPQTPRTQQTPRAPWMPQTPQASWTQPEARFRPNLGRSHFELRGLFSDPQEANVWSMCFGMLHVIDDQVPCCSTSLPFAGSLPHPPVGRAPLEDWSRRGPSTAPFLFAGACQIAHGPEFAFLSAPREGAG